MPRTCPSTAPKLTIEGDGATRPCHDLRHLPVATAPRLLAQRVGLLPPDRVLGEWLVQQGERLEPLDEPLDERELVRRVEDLLRDFGRRALAVERTRDGLLHLVDGERAVRDRIQDGQAALRPRREAQVSPQERAIPRID